MDKNNGKKQKTGSSFGAVRYTGIKLIDEIIFWLSYAVDALLIFLCWFFDEEDGKIAPATWVLRTIAFVVLVVVLVMAISGRL